MRLFALALLLPLTASAGTTIDVNDMTVNGLEIAQITCTLTSGGLFASMAVAAELANQKTAYDACHPAGAAVRLSWRWDGGHTHDVAAVASSHPPANDCMVRALSVIASQQSGTCTATLLIGDATAAHAAAEGLAAPATPDPVAPAEK